MRIASPIDDRLHGSAGPGIVADPFRRRQIYFESGLEYRHLVTLIVNPSVVDIREQQTRRYLVEGRRRQYTTDFLVELRSGGSVAYEVKYEADAVRAGTAALLEEVASHVGDCLASKYSLLTELHVTDVAVANAEVIISCARDFDIDGQSIVRELLNRSRATVTLREIGEKSGLGERGERAATTLIQQGLLTLLDPGSSLSPNVKLRNLCTQ